MSRQNRTTARRCGPPRRRLARLVEVLCDQHPGKHAAVAVEEVAEVVVAGHLSAVGARRGAQRVLDVGVAGPARHGLAARRYCGGPDGAGDPRVVDDRLAGVLREGRPRK